MERRLTYQLALFGWRTGLILFAVSLAASLTFSRPDTIRQALADSGAYPVLAERLSATAVAEVTKQADARLPKDQVEAAAKETFTVQAVQMTTEHGIDDIYDWLRGNTAEPKLAIDVPAYSQAFSRNLVARASQQGLLGDRADDDNRPACTVTELQSFMASIHVDATNTITGANPDDLACSVVKGLSGAISQSISSGTGQASDALPVYMPDGEARAFGIANSSTLAEQYDNLPVIYSWLRLSPAIFGLLVIASGAVVVANRQRSRQEQIRRLAKSSLFVGIGVLALAGLTWQASHLLVKSIANPIAGLDARYQDIFANLIAAFSQRFSTILAITAMIYVVASVVLMIHRRQPNKSPAADKVIV